MASALSTSFLEGSCWRDCVRGKCSCPVRTLFYGRPSEYLWEDASGEVHKIPQGEGRDAMMPLLFSLGQPKSEGVCMLRCRMHQGGMLASRSTAGKPRSGTEQVSGLGQAVNTTALFNVAGGTTRDEGSGDTIGPSSTSCSTLVQFRENRKSSLTASLVQDLQSAWLLLHCASACANYLMRAVSPDSTLRGLLSPMTKHCGNVCA